MQGRGTQECYAKQEMLYCILKTQQKSLKRGNKTEEKEKGAKKSLDISRHAKK